MNIAKISPGYPCHKYILRNINCEEDLWSYAKAFVSTAIQNGIQHELAMSMLSVSLNDLPHKSGLLCPDFTHIGTTPKDSCLMLMNYTGVPTFKSCNTFYKKYDAKTPCCRICPISSIFYNGNESIEFSIIKYMFLSEENFNFVTDYIDASYFRSAMDVCMEIPYSKACVVPVLSEIVKSSLKQNIRILLFDEKSQLYFNNNNSSAFDIAWEDMVNRMPRERRVPSIVKNNPMWESVLRKTVLEQIQSAPDFSMEELRDILLKYLQMPEETTFEMPSCNQPAQWSPTCLMDIIETSIPSIQKTTSNIDLTELSIEENLSNQVTNSPSAHLSRILSDTISFSRKHQIIKTPTLANKGNESTDTHDSSSSPSTTSLPSFAGKSPVVIPCSIEMKRDMIIHICICKKEINLWCIYLKSTDYLSDNAYQGILRDKHMYIEVIKVSDKKCFQYAYLIYIVHEKRFYLTYCRDTPKQIIDLLSRRAVKKVCHTPYLLYGISALCHRQIRNVMSLQTAHAHISEKLEVMNYENLINSYLPNDSISPASRRTGPNCIFYYGMPFYSKIVQVMENMINHFNNPLLYEMDLCIDEAIGYSFFYERNFNNTGFIAKLLPNGSFLYPKEFEKNPKATGYYVSYTVNNHTSSDSFFRYLLYQLSYDGHMRKHNIQLIGLHRNIINFFIATECFEYLTTTINIYIFEYSELHSNHKMVIDQLIECAKDKLK